MLNSVIYLTLLNMQISGLYMQMSGWPQADCDSLGKKRLEFGGRPQPLHSLRLLSHHTIFSNGCHYLALFQRKMIFVCGMDPKPDQYTVKPRL